MLPQIEFYLLLIFLLQLIITIIILIEYANSEGV